MRQKDEGRVGVALEHLDAVTHLGRDALVGSRSAARVQRLAQVHAPLAVAVAW